MKGGIRTRSQLSRAEAHWLTDFHRIDAVKDLLSQFTLKSVACKGRRSQYTYVLRRKSLAEDFPLGM